MAHVIDPKALSKEDLYGVLDPNTREWTDGLFTHILRKIIDNVRGELDKRQWIIFDGDVDPVWIENLNRDGVPWFWLVNEMKNEYVKPLFNTFALK